LIASRLRSNSRVSLVSDPIDTNIVVFSLGPDAPDAAAVIAAARARGVLVVAFGARTVRAVTHLDVNADGVQTALEALERVCAR